MPSNYLWVPASAVDVVPQSSPSWGVVMAARMSGTIGLPQGFGKLNPCTLLGSLRSRMGAFEDLSQQGNASFGVMQGLAHAQGCMFWFDAYARYTNDSWIPDMRLIKDSLWLRIDAKKSLPSNEGEWSSMRGFRGAETAAQKGVMGEIGNWTQWAKGAEEENSTIGDAPVRSVYTGDAWFTDMYDTRTDNTPAGQLIDLLKSIDDWYKAAPTPKPTTAPADTKAFKDTVPYWLPNKHTWRDDRDLLVSRAVSFYLQKKDTVTLPARPAPKAAPTAQGANDAMAYLEYKADCKETADRIVQAQGGTVRSYSDVPQKGVLAIDVRPGMYAYLAHTPSGSPSHTMLVSDAYWDGSGQLKRLRIAESNKGSGWGHPTGMVPWKRRRWRDREVRLDQQLPTRLMRDLNTDPPVYYIVLNV